MDDGFLNLDEFCVELESPELVVQFKGEKYNLPPLLPASIPISLIRKQQDLSQEIPMNMMVEVFETLFSPEDFQKMLDSGLTMNEVEHLFTWVMEKYAQRRQMPMSKKGV